MNFSFVLRRQAVELTKPRTVKVPYTSQRTILSIILLSTPNIFLTLQVRFFGTFLGVFLISRALDGILLRAGVKFARQLAQTQPLSAALITELSPGAGVNSDETWDNWVAQTAGTEFHPSSTCAMLPFSQGGVVDTDLRVYGLANVRVADSSVFPMQFAAHVRHVPSPVPEIYY